MTASFKEDAAAAIELLRRHAGFAAIDDEYLGTLVAQSPIETLHNGAIAFAQGEPGDFAYLVLSGELAVEVETQWGRVRVAVMKSGDLVGEIAAFATLPRTASVIALGAVKVLRLEQGAIRMLVADHPEAAIAIIGDLGRKLHNLNTSTATLVQAASALAEGDFRPAMLEAMEGQADRFGHFAGVFDAMAREITQKRALLQEMRTAAAIQQSFLPKGLDLGGHAGRCDLFATMLPAKQVGGVFLRLLHDRRRSPGFRRRRRFRQGCAGRDLHEPLPHRVEDRRIRGWRTW
jgi:CRP-like cAMP-binding protein